MGSIRSKAAAVVNLAEEQGLLVVLRAMGCKPGLSIPLHGSLRGLPTDRLSLTPQQVSVLRSAGLSTAGKIADFICAGHDLCAFRDIGRNTADKLDGELMYLAYVSLSDNQRISFWADIIRAASRAA